jgi:hypothetical protein
MMRASTSFPSHSAHAAQLADLRPFLREDAILGKIVDVANSPRAALDEIAAAAAMSKRPAICKTDARDADTCIGNYNGGFYSIPRALLQASLGRVAPLGALAARQ